MSIVRLLRYRFLRRREADCLLQEGPLLKLLVFSGALSPHTVTHPHSGHPDELWHTTYHHILTVEPCFQNDIAPSSFPAVYDTTGLSGVLDGGLLDWDGVFWAVPKKRTSHSKKRMRMNHKYLKPKGHYTVCPNCQNLKLLHVLCGHCLKETLRLTAETRRAQIEQRLLSGWGDTAGGGGGEESEQQISTSETAAR